MFSRNKIKLPESANLTNNSATELFTRMLLLEKHEK